MKKMSKFFLLPKMWFFSYS